MLTLFRDWRNQISWGRICAAVALVVAVWREFTGADLWHVALWLGVATGSYGISKGTEVVALLKNVGAAAPPATENGVVSERSAVEGSAKTGGLVTSRELALIGERPVGDAGAKIEAQP